MPTAEDIGRAIRTARDKEGYTQEDLSLLIGVSEKKVWRWENGSPPTKLEDMVALRRELSLPMEALTVADANDDPDVVELKQAVQRELEALAERLEGAEISPGRLRLLQARIDQLRDSLP